MTPPDRKQAPEIRTIENVELTPLQHIANPGAPDIHILDKKEFDDIVRVTFITAGGFTDVASPALASLAVTQLRDGSLSMTGHEVAARLEQCGARLSAAAGARHRFVTLYTLGSQFERTLPILADIICNPTYPALEFEKARQLVASQIELEQRKVAYCASMRAKALVMGETNPLAVTDSPEQALAATPDDARDFHARHLWRDSSAFYIAGRVTQQMTDLLADTALKMNLTEGIDPALNDPGRLAFDGCRTSQRHNIKMPEARQSAVSIAIPVVAPADPAFTELQNAVTALGGYFGSRLMTEVRERQGLTYGISADLMPTPTASVLRINAECDAANVDRLIDTTLRQIDLLAQAPPAGAELERLRAFMMTSLAQVVDSPFAQIIRHLALKINDMPANNFARRVEAVRVMTSEKIAQAAASMIVGRPVVTVVAG